MNNGVLRPIFEIFRFFFPTSPEVQRLEEMAVKDYTNTLQAADKNIGNVYALWKYGDPLVKTAVWEIKYGKNNRVGEKVGEILHAHITDILEDNMMFENQKQILLIPIPSFKSKRFKKGYNQTELICKMIKKYDRENILEYRDNVLVRTRETIPQTKIKTKKERERNPKNSFAVIGPENIQGKIVALIDDVMTTGSTLKEASFVLKEAGAREVKPFVIAH